jgi:hypothetical protein
MRFLGFEMVLGVFGRVFETYRMRGKKVSCYIYVTIVGDLCHGLVLSVRSIGHKC